VKVIFVAAVLLLADCGGRSTTTAGREPTLPRAPAVDASVAESDVATKQLTTWLTAFNSGDREVLRAYLEASAPKFVSALEFLVSLRHATGGLELKRSEPGSSTKAVVILRERRADAFYRTTVEIEPAEPHHIAGIDLRPIDPPDDLLSPGDRAGANLDASRRASLIDGIARELLAHYVFVDKAQKMIAALRDHVSHGDYDGIVRSWDFARRVTEDLRSVSHDSHLALDYGRRSATEPSREERLAWLRSIHFGVAAIERLERNVVRLAIDQFPLVEDEEARQAIADRVSEIADADALLVDLRQNRGGSADTVAMVASYFFGATPVHLNDLVRRDDGSTKQFWTARDVRGKRFGAKKPIYVLVGKGTFSAGEELAYDLQCLHRAKIVGESTAGGAHAGEDYPLDAWFRIDVPSQRAINPITKTNWEGVGVVPDIAVPAESALTEALRRAIADLPHP
jgi:hypothetical protein